MTVTDVHPDLEPLRFLIGTWAGPGHGEYPTIPSFDYLEEVTFVAPPGKPFLAYTQRTRDAADNRALHAEAGYWRLAGPGGVEVVIAQPTGIAEILEGTVDGQRIGLRSRTVSRTTTAKVVTETTRTFELIGDELVYRVAMASVGLPLTDHLAARLRRQA